MSKEGEETCHSERTPRDGAKREPQSSWSGLGMTAFLFESSERGGTAFVRIPNPLRRGGGSLLNAKTFELFNFRPSTYIASIRLQNPRRNHHPLNLAFAPVDLGDAGVAVHPLDGIFAIVAIPAVDLDGLVGDARGHLRGEQLGNGRFHAEARADVLLPSGFAREQARGVNFRGHICEHELDGLEIGDGMAEGHTLLRIFQRFLKRALGNPHGLRGNADAPAVERGERDLVAFALSADSVLDGHFAVGEGKLDAGRGVDAEFLLFFADFEARRAALDHQRGDALFALWRGRIYIDDRGVSGTAVGGPSLRAGPDVAGALAHRMRREGRGLKTRLPPGWGRSTGL